MPLAWPAAQAAQVLEHVGRVATAEQGVEDSRL